MVVSSKINNVSVPKTNTPFEYGSSPGENARGKRVAANNKQVAANKRYRGGKYSGGFPANYGKSPDVPTGNVSTVASFNVSGSGSSQNSNSASIAGNTNVAVGTANQKYDICATNPNSPVCAGTAMKISQPKPKSSSKKGGSSMWGSSMRGSSMRGSSMRGSGKRRTQRCKKCSCQTCKCGGRKTRRIRKKVQRRPTRKGRGRTRRRGRR